MMMRILVPEDIDEGSVGNWYFDDGAPVRADELICEVMVEKTTIEVRSPVAGILRIHALSDSVVHKGATLAVIETAENHRIAEGG
jgi:pyruvate/2-oxoglutarate dehydrogenase complex dihydrolipoamide acyltransferase (E2) component